MFWIRRKKKHLIGNANDAKNALVDSRLCLTHYGTNHQSIRMSVSFGKMSAHLGVHPEVSNVGQNDNR